MLSSYFMTTCYQNCMKPVTATVARVNGMAKGMDLNSIGNIQCGVLHIFLDTHPNFKHYIFLKCLD